MNQPTYNDYKRVEMYAKRLAEAIEALHNRDDADAIAWLRQWQAFARDKANEIEREHQRTLEF